MVACAWHDTKRLHFLSTIHTNNTIDKRIRSKNAEGDYKEVEKKQSLLKHITISLFFAILTTVNFILHFFSSFYIFYQSGPQ